MVKVTWTGAAGLEITNKGRTYLVDPYYSRPSKFEIFFTRPVSKAEVVRERLRRLPGEPSALILGHTHIDHALDVPVIMQDLNLPCVGSQSLENLLAAHGLPGRVTVCEGGETVKLPGGMVVTMIKSLHGLVLFGRVPYAGKIEAGLTPPLKTNEYKHGTVFTPKIEIGGVVFMHLGSDNMIESELEGHECDVLFMGVPGWNRIPDFPGRLLRIVKPKVIVPFHFDDFSAALSAMGTAPRLPLIKMDECLAQAKKALPNVEFRYFENINTTLAF